MATELQDEMREALETLTDTVRDAARYLAAMLEELEAGTYNADHAHGDQEYWETAGVWSALAAVVDARDAMEDDAVECDCPNCDSGRDCLPGFCAVCLTDLGTGEGWGARCDTCGEGETV